MLSIAEISCFFYRKSWSLNPTAKLRYGCFCATHFGRCRNLFCYYFGGIAASDSAYCDTCYRCVVDSSVRLYVCRLSHSCTRLKRLDEIKCHGRDTHVVPNDTALHRDPLDPPGKEEIRGWNPQFAAMPACRNCQVTLALAIIVLNDNRVIRSSWLKPTLKRL